MPLWQWWHSNPEAAHDINLIEAMHDQDTINHVTTVPRYFLLWDVMSQVYLYVIWIGSPASMKSHWQDRHWASSHLSISQVLVQNRKTGKLLSRERDRTVVLSLNLLIGHVCKQKTWSWHRSCPSPPNSKKVKLPSPRLFILKTIIG